MRSCLPPSSRTTGLKGSGCLKGFLVPRFLCVDSGMMLRSAFQDSTNAELLAPTVEDYWAQGVGMLERVSSPAVSVSGMMLRSASQDSTNAELLAPTHELEDYWLRFRGMRMTSQRVTMIKIRDDRLFRRGQVPIRLPREALQFLIRC